MKNVVLDIILLFSVICVVFHNSVYGEKLLQGSSVKLKGNILEDEDISAIGKLGSFLVIGTDEAVGKDKTENYIQLLTKKKNNTYVVDRNILLFKGNTKEGKKGELDIEGIAVQGNQLYVIGSHSSRRDKVKRKKNEYQVNRETFKNIQREKNREWLYRLTMDNQGKEIKKNRISLRKLLENDPVLKPFINIPSKENGIDIEGIAVKEEWLYIGFRGPVLLGNYVPILKLKFDDFKDGYSFKDIEKKYELLYIKLGGRGIRDMVHVSDGFLILAGPVGSGSDSYQLYHWDGKDGIPGKNREESSIATIRLLGKTEPPKNGKAEGIVVLKENTSSYQFIIVYDGVEKKKNIAQSFLVSKL